MFIVRVFKVRRHERGLYFHDREFRGVLAPGRHWVFDPLRKVRVDVVSVREPWLRHAELDVIARSGALKDEARVVDLKAHERALVWVDDRFEAVLRPGLYALWTVFRDVRVELLDAREPLLRRDDLPQILAGRGAAEALEVSEVPAHAAGLYFRDGAHAATLGPGAHAFWKGVARAQIVQADLREQVLDIAGQELMTADKVTLRLNALAQYRVTDPLRALSAVDDYRQALYREAQLALRAVIGTRELDVLLAEKDAVARELEGLVRERATAFGVEVRALGIRDIILPGEMKDLLNQVTEAKKAAEASLIQRREETAAMRMQANTAKLLEASPTLMRLRELEVLEKVAEKSKLSVVLGEKGLTDRVMKLL